MTQHITTRRSALGALTAAAAVLAGCGASAPRPRLSSGASACPSIGEVPPPQGVDLPRMQLLDGGVRWGVYSRLKPSHQVEGAWQTLPAALAEALSATQVDHLLANAIRASRRFTWFDSGHSPSYEYSNTRIELMLLPVEQQLKPMGSGWLKLLTRMPISATVTDLQTGQDLLGSDLTATGYFGHIAGSGLQVRSEQELTLAHNIEGRRHDIRAALVDALDKLRIKLETKLLPIARVEIAEPCTLHLTGGTLHGFQKGDRLIVFRPLFVERDGLRLLAGATPVAQAHCDAAHAQSSQCRLRRVAPGLTPRPGDYAVLTADSLQQPRLE